MDRDVENLHEPRVLVGMLDLSVPEDTTLDHVETQNGRLEINPSIPLKAKELYRLQLWNDGTISLWMLVAEGAKGPVDAI
jgi:hypothetical protein